MMEKIKFRELDRQRIAEYLLQLRKEHEYTPRDICDFFADRGAELTEPAVGKWEKGSIPTLDHLCMLRELYGVDLDGLLCRRDFREEERDGDQPGPLFSE